MFPFNLNFSKGGSSHQRVAPIVLSMVGIFIAGILAGYAETSFAPRKPTHQDKCPICGMFVYKYPDWVAQVIYQDGHVLFFDGVKDLMKYILTHRTYSSKDVKKIIADIYVTDYYSLTPIKAQKAFFVVGSNVYGPMGREIIPFARKEEAEEFMRDHEGKWLLTFLHDLS